MTELVLKKIAKHFGDAPWLEKENDYLVLNDAGRIIGRIVIRARSPKGRPWVWTITAREQPPSFSNNQGYSETREQAMKDFKAQYSVLRFVASLEEIIRYLDPIAQHVELADQISEDDRAIAGHYGSARWVGPSEPPNWRANFSASVKLAKRQRPYRVPFF